MWKYILKRLGMAAATLFVILFILYCLLEFMPGSPFNELELTEAQMARLYEKYGLDKPFLQRFFIYVGNMLRGDFGVSYNIQQDYPVVKLISFEVSCVSQNRSDCRSNRYGYRNPFWNDCSSKEKYMAGFGNHLYFRYRCQPSRLCICAGLILLYRI